MKKKEKKQSDWTEQLQTHNENCNIVLEELRELNRMYQNGMDVKRLLLHVLKAMEKIRTEADQLHDEMFIIPLRKVFSADRLKVTKQQYWLARAAGFEAFTAKQLGICPVDDYEVYKNCVYEDDEKVFFIDPNETPDVETTDEKSGGTRIRPRIACSPEETDLHHYRPEQIRFFDKYQPDVTARAQKKHQSQSADATETAGC